MLSSSSDIAAGSPSRDGHYRNVPLLKGGGGGGFGVGGVKRKVGKHPEDTLELRRGGRPRYQWGPFSPRLCVYLSQPGGHSPPPPPAGQPSSLPRGGRAQIHLTAPPVKSFLLAKLVRGPRPRPRDRKQRPFEPPPPPQPGTHNMSSAPLTYLYRSSAGPFGSVPDINLPGWL